MKQILLTFSIYALFLPSLFAQANLTLTNCYTLKASLEEISAVPAGTYSFVLERETLPQLWKKVKVVDSKKQEVSFKDLPEATYRVTIVSPTHQKTKQTKVYHRLMKEEPQSLSEANTFLSNPITLMLDSDCDFEKKNGLSSKPQNTFSSSMNIYPNPSQNTIWVEWGGATKITQLSIYSITGIRLKHLTSTDKRMEVDVSNIPPGVYLVKISNAETSIATQRISIIR